MKKRIKGEKCLNCGFKFNNEDNYCPECGQKNNTNQLSFGQLIREFFSNYISFDSRFGRTVVPFLIKPGSLTKAFMEGKRVSFANPIRWYLVVSLVHFFVLSQVSKTFTEEGQKIFRTTATSSPGISLSAGSDTLRIKDNDAEELAETDANKDNDFITNDQLSIIEQMSNAGAKKKEILDSLHIEELTFWRGLVIKQTVKLSLDDQFTLNTYIIQNVPILIFILLPLYALLLKLFFRKRLYINHLIHSIYIHSFFFFGLTFYWIAFYFMDNKPPEIFNIAIFAILAFHNFKSFKNLYDLKTFRAIWTLFLSGIIYSTLLLIGFLLLVLVSLILF